VIAAGSPSRAVVAVADAAPADRVARLQDRGVTVLACKSDGGRVDVVDLASRLFALDAIGMLVEGGGALHASFVNARLVDRVAVFVAPKLLGGDAAPAPVGGPGLALSDALALETPTARSLGPDWLLEADVASPAAAGDRAEQR
jgi:diaminohydroxyphosphoribosylaminopyrimidine deaminase/5-amino-6-(5-phosphoribosylamino)uracil reductase